MLSVTGHQGCTNKTAVTYDFMLTKMAVTKQSDDGKRWRGAGGLGTLARRGGHVKWCSRVGKPSGSASKSSTRCYHMAQQSPGFVHKTDENTHPHTLDTNVHSCQQVQAPKEPYRGMGTQKGPGQRGSVWSRRGTPSSAATRTDLDATMPSERNPVVRDFISVQHPEQANP